MLPNLLIIGAAKCGTTSLHHYLAQHPEIEMSRRKELNLFGREDWRDRLDWYERQFPVDASVRGESSPGYSMYPLIGGVPERIHSLVPDAKLVYLVRDPIDRLIAHWVEFYALHREHRPLDEAVSDVGDPANPYLCASRYATQVERYLRRFPDTQLLVLDSRELLEARHDTLRTVFSFLGVDPDFKSPVFDSSFNVREQKVRANALGAWLWRKGLWKRLRRWVRPLPSPLRRGGWRLIADDVATPELDAALRERLDEVFAEEAERLRSHTGKAFAGWSV